MSFNSPAKQERIERHLMRQRGAGIRTVSTSFGFAFGSQSEDFSSNATPTRDIDGPPAKRRKTVLCNELTANENRLPVSSEATTSKKTVRSRRRFALEDEDIRPQQRPNAEDDSFVAVIGSKKTKKANTQCKNETEAGVGTSSKSIVVDTGPVVTTVRGPRERAAAKASSKVAEELVEETIAIDKKRRDPEPAKRAVRARGKKAIAKSGAKNDKVHDGEPDEDCTNTAKPLRKRRAATKKGKTEPAVLVEAQRVEATSPEIDELAVDIAVRSEIDGDEERHDTESRKSTIQPVSSKTRARQSAARKTKRQVSKNADGATQPCEQSLIEPQPRQSTKMKKICEAGEREGEPREKRRPLVEADINIAMHSPSPKKVTQQPSKDPQRLTKAKSRPCTRTLEHPPSPPPKVVARKKRKLNIKADTTEDENQSAGSELPSEHCEDLHSPAAHLPEIKDAKQSSLDWAAMESHRSADQQQGIQTAVQRRGNLNDDQANAKISSSLQSFAVPTLESKQRANGKTKASTIPCDAGGPISAPPIGLSATGNAAKRTKAIFETQAKDVEEGNDDVDWLFAPQPQANGSKRAVAKSKPASLPPKDSRSKMPEMDLDDLLSNIASFAHDKTISGGLNIPLFGRSQQKPKSSSRKKTKL